MHCNLNANIHTLWHAQTYHTYSFTDNMLNHYVVPFSSLYDTTDSAYVHTFYTYTAARETDRQTDRGTNA